LLSLLSTTATLISVALTISDVSQYPVVERLL
jgi:hypothetical protein